MRHSAYRNGQPYVADEVVGGPAPLRGAFDVTRQLAGVEHVAAGVDDGVERRALTAQRRGHRLVDQGEPLGRVPLADPDQPELGQRTQLEIDIAGLPRQLQRSLGERLRSLEIRHPVRPGHPGVAVQGTRLEGSNSRSARPIHPLAAAELAKLAL